MDRRDFLKAAAAVPAAAVTPPVAEAEQPPSPIPEASTVSRPGSDFMVDVLKSLDFEYAFSNPANTFRSLHESIVNYGGNARPEFITCTHEEIATAMAHGYAKIEGRPALVAVHGTVGTQHASMAVYDAFCDRVPVYLILGNHLDAMGRRSVVTWSHSAQDAAAIVRDYIKWDDAPVSLPHFAESAVRAYRIATTPPMGPIAIVADADLQERASPAGDALRIPKLAPTAPPQGDAGAVAEAAKLLVAAENPVLLVDRMARTPYGMAHLVELAELLQASRRRSAAAHELSVAPSAVCDERRSGRRRHARPGGPISGHRRPWATSPARASPTPRCISITADDLLNHKSNYQDAGRYGEADLEIPGDAEATLPALIDAVKRLITADRRRVFDDRRGVSWPRHTGRRGSCRARKRRSAGTRARSARRGCRPRCGRRSRTKTGRWSARTTG